MRIRRSTVIACAALAMTFASTGSAQAGSGFGFGGSTFGPNGGMGPAGWDYEKVRVGKGRTVSMVARGRSCIEVDKSKANCVGLSIPPGTIDAKLRATGDFEIIAPKAGCRFPVLSWDGTPCPFRVRFEPTKTGRRTGKIFSNGYGQVLLRGYGVNKKLKPPPKPGPGIPIDGGCCVPFIERGKLTGTGPDPVQLHVFDTAQNHAWAGAPFGIPGGSFSSTFSSFSEALGYTRTVYYFACLPSDSQPGTPADVQMTIRDPDGTVRTAGPVSLDGSGDQEAIDSSPAGAPAPSFPIPALCA